LGEGGAEEYLRRRKIKQRKQKDKNLAKNQRGRKTKRIWGDKGVWIKTGRVEEEEEGLAQNDAVA